MNPLFNHSMHSWTKSLSKVEKINLGRYGLSPIITLRGVVVDWDFLWACIRLWDPEAHIFRFGGMMEEMCPLFEEFCAIIGCDPNAPLVRHEVKVGPFSGPGSEDRETAETSVSPVRCCGPTSEGGGSAPDYVGGGGIPLDFSEEDDDGSSSDDGPPSPPPQVAAGPSRRHR
ncbi:hypothetical protein JCGZ_19672 [Jatropha curcas]|uniref:Aminotransferase-like plant mobile domain-containing protein n=1 Tax=Jatropha curcas TaxID=180498 RepID=A0A067LQI3_JATCU|nr:hypothetical protein JCGZ_19672 [Jatropha curcas]